VVVQGPDGGLLRILLICLIKVTRNHIVSF
jgi:hypothetical protein